MRKKLLVSALMVAMLQLGCAHQVDRSVAASSKPDMAPCSTNNDCRIAVYVSIGAKQECQVQLLFGTVTIAAGKQPKVVWRIEKADPHGGDSFEYRFAFDPNANPPIYGVDIIGNDPSQDFDDPGYDNADKGKFKWKSKHDRRMSFDYTVKVQRSANGMAPWSDCTLLDPRIVNA